MNIRNLHLHQKKPKRSFSESDLEKLRNSFKEIEKQLGIFRGKKISSSSDNSDEKLALAESVFCASDSEKHEFVHYDTQNKESFLDKASTSLFSEKIYNEVKALILEDSFLSEHNSVSENSPFSILYNRLDEILSALVALSDSCTSNKKQASCVMRIEQEVLNFSKKLEDFSLFNSHEDHNRLDQIVHSLEEIIPVLSNSGSLLSSLSTRLVDASHELCSSSDRNQDLLGRLDERFNDVLKKIEETSSNRFLDEELDKKSEIDSKNQPLSEDVLSLKNSLESQINSLLSSFDVALESCSEKPEEEFFLKEPLKEHQKRFISGKDVIHQNQEFITPVLSMHDFPVENTLGKTEGGEIPEKTEHCSLHESLETVTSSCIPQKQVDEQKAFHWGHRWEFEEKNLNTLEKNQDNLHQDFPAPSKNPSSVANEPHFFSKNFNPEAFSEELIASVRKNFNMEALSAELIASVRHALEHEFLKHKNIPSKEMRSFEKWKGLKKIFFVIACFTVIFSVFLFFVFDIPLSKSSKSFTLVSDSENGKKGIRFSGAPSYTENKQSDFMESVETVSDRNGVLKSYDKDQIQSENLSSSKTRRMARKDLSAVLRFNNSLMSPAHSLSFFGGASFPAFPQKTYLFRDEARDEGAFLLSQNAQFYFNQRLDNAERNGRVFFEIADIFSEKHMPRYSDMSKAIIFYMKSAELGFAPAQYRIGNIYEKGIGVSQDINQAKIWYERASEQGNVHAMHNLGGLYAEGFHGQPDYESSMIWFRKAAEYGLRDSQFNLAVLYFECAEDSEDLEESYKWFAHAAKQNDLEAAQKRDKISKIFSKERLEALNSEISSWVPKSINARTNLFEGQRSL